MDRQAVFKRISKVLMIIALGFLIISTAIASIILYSAFRVYVEAYKPNMSQFCSNIKLYIVSIAVGSLIVGIMLSSHMEAKNKIRKTIILTGIIFYGITVSILFEVTLYQYGYFPVIFFGYFLITIVCKVISVIPNGIISKVKCYLKTKRIGE